jgi:hypothetical protein
VALQVVVVAATLLACRRMYGHARCRLADAAKLLDAITGETKS